MSDDCHLEGTRIELFVMSVTVQTLKQMRVIQ